jgi:predicted YcjX-like family ATPase
MTLTTGLSGTFAGLRDFVSDASSSVERLVNEDHIRLAVTGLSRAGKTVFITSLVHNLLALGQGRNTLPKVTKRLTVDGTSRLRSVTVLPVGAALLPHFNPSEKLTALASDSPDWPAPTTDLAQVSLEIEIERLSRVRQRLGRRRVRLDILDYPGEWLLDLPMLDQSFSDWSTATLALLRASPRREVCGRFLEFEAAQRFDDRAEEGMIQRGHALYREALDACRKRFGLRYLQPGRFVCPGWRSDAPFMWFFPLDMPRRAGKAGTVGALLQERFEAYKRDMRLVTAQPAPGGR